MDARIHIEWPLPVRKNTFGGDGVWSKNLNLIGSPEYGYYRLFENIYVHMNKSTEQNVFIWVWKFKHQMTITKQWPHCVCSQCRHVRGARSKPVDTHTLPFTSVTSTRILCQPHLIHRNMLHMSAFSSADWNHNHKFIEINLITSMPLASPCVHVYVHVFTSNHTYTYALSIANKLCAQLISYNYRQP